jgi:hypothetical protein
MPLDLAKFKTTKLNGIKVDRKKFINLVTRLAPLADQTIKQYIVDTGSGNLKKTDAVLVLMNNRRFMDAFFGELSVASSVDFYWGPETWEPEKNGFDWKNIGSLFTTFTSIVSSLFGSKKPANVGWEEYWLWLQEQQEKQKSNLMPILLIGGGLLVFILIFMIVMAGRR